MADLHSKLDELTDMVHGAKPLPLSASCVVNRTEVLAALDEIRALLPGEIAAASGVLQHKAGVVDEGRLEAQRIIAEAADERDRLVGHEEVAAEAQRQAEVLLSEAREQTDTMRREVEDYVDGKLANFEVVLHKTIAAVERGRERLRGRHDDGLSGDAPLEPLPAAR